MGINLKQRLRGWLGSPGGAGGAETPTMMGLQDITDTVRHRYGAFAAAGGEDEACCAAMASTASYAREHGLYSPAELATLPDLAINLSRGCGNPTGFADLQPGEVVVDFGSGGGIDAILAARQIGPEGRVVGLDLTADMIKQAQQTVAEAELGDRELEFREADLTETGLPDGFADVVLSNCVINLCPDKAAAYAEAFRILRPGGRIAISDIILATPIPDDLAARFQATWVGCLGGAIPEEEYLATIRAAGFTEPAVIARNPLKALELEAMARCPGENYTPAPAAADIAAVQGNVISIKFTASKPT